jgi:hypothetical protein
LPQTLVAGSSWVQQYYRTILLLLGSVLVRTMQLEVVGVAAM